jgi:hypothetical protein
MRKVYTQKKAKWTLSCKSGQRAKIVCRAGRVRAPRADRAPRARRPARRAHRRTAQRRHSTRAELYNSDAPRPRALPHARRARVPAPRPRGSESAVAAEPRAASGSLQGGVELRVHEGDQR